MSVWRWLVLLAAGLAAGAVLALVAVAALLWNAADWLVVDGHAVPAEAAVVLGGGSGERLRKALDLYEAEVVERLILVGDRADDWRNILHRHCTSCRLEGRPVSVINGSVDTASDARLVRRYCAKAGIASLLVVTDPYHTRRAQVTFAQALDGTGVRSRVVGTGAYGRLVPPDRRWRRDRKTAERVWMELGKIGHLYASDLLGW